VTSGGKSFHAKWLRFSANFLAVLGIAMRTPGTSPLGKVGNVDNFKYCTKAPYCVNVNIPDLLKCEQRFAAVTAIRYPPGCHATIAT
jgi:hypothetical protein